MRQSAVPTPQLTDVDLPELFRSADATSSSAQHRFHFSTGAQLALLALAAMAGASQARWPQFVAVAALFSAVVLKSYLVTTNPDRTWYEARAAAESAKTLAWRYAVGGDPFRVDSLSEGEADRLFLARLSDVVKPLKETTLVPSLDGMDQITGPMRELRGLSLAERKAAYRAGRLRDQRVWYTRKARWNSRRADLWSAVMLVFELLGVIAAVVRISSSFSYDLVAVAAAIAGMAAAWSQSKQHMVLASAYSVTARELADVESLIDEPKDEPAWGDFVRHAEEAVSREHTLWRASRGT